nr:WD40 repeat and U3 small nucleolar RNA-associated protein 15 domain containing protein [Haemonchus contortus]
MNEFCRKADDDVIYWKRMQQLAVLQEPASVSSIAFSPNKPYNVASTSSVRLSLYDTIVCEPINMFSRFKRAVCGVKFRRDGELLAVGGEEGKARIFDLTQSSGIRKAPLRSINASQATIRCVEFSPCGRMLYTMASDGRVKHWDISDTGAAAVCDYAAHQDEIRTSAVSTLNHNLMLTGGYDHKVKLWDSRCLRDGPSVEMDAGFPVENAIFLNSEHLVATAAGPLVKVWDVTVGGRLLMSLQQHNKSVMSLCLGAVGDILLTGGLDRKVNVIRVLDFSLLHSMPMASPVLALAMSPDDQTMAVGMGHLLAIHHRAPESKGIVSAQTVDKRAMIRTAAPKVQMQEAGKSKESVEIKAKSSDMHRLSKVDTLLRGYQHAAAIRKMFHSYFFHSRKEEVVAWLLVILRRGAIHRAIAGQENNVLCNMLKFIHAQLFRGNHFDVLNRVVDAFFEVYGNEELDSKVAKLALSLKTAVARELVVQKQLAKTLGALESIINGARVTSVRHEAPQRRQTLAENGLKELSTKNGDPFGLFGEPALGSVPLDLLDTRG